MQMSENDICLNCITLFLVDFLQKHIFHIFCGVRNNYSCFKLMFFVLWSHNVVPRTFGKGPGNEGGGLMVGVGCSLLRNVTISWVVTQ